MAQLTADKLSKEVTPHFDPGAQIYALMSKVMSDLDPVGKDGTNKAQGYRYRSVNAIYAAVRKALTDNGVSFVPVLESYSRTERPRCDDKGQEIGIWATVTVEVAYTFSAIDGSKIIAKVPGEGIDVGDKATKKAMTSAVKTMLEEVFCIETGEDADGEQDSPEPASQSRPPLKTCPKCGAVAVMPSRYGSGYYCTACKSKLDDAIS